MSPEERVKESLLGLYDTLAEVLGNHEHARVVANAVNKLVDAKVALGFAAHDPGGTK